MHISKPDKVKWYKVFIPCSLFYILLLSHFNVSAQILKRPIPDHLIVLTFDDAASSQYHIVAPVLKKYNFNATFFVCEFPPDFPDTTKYMSWNQIQQLNEWGFEIGNHTWKHIRLSRMNAKEFVKQVKYIDRKCKKYKIPKPVSFAYPVWKGAPYAISRLKEMGFLFARTGGNRAYDPLKDHPYLIPSFHVANMDSSAVLQAFNQAKNGKIVVLTIHGVPDNAHDWVSTPPRLFNAYMKYLHDHHYKVISMRDLKTYINVKQAILKIPPVFN